MVSESARSRGPGRRADGQDLDHEAGHDEDRLREDDRHDAGIVDLERQEGGLAAVDLVAADLLGVLDGDFALRLRDGDGAGDDGEEEKEQRDDQDRAPRPVLPPPVPVSICQPCNKRGGQARDDVDGDDHRDTVADALVGDLFAQPHQQQRAGEQADDGGEFKGEARDAARAGRTCW